MAHISGQRDMRMQQSSTNSSMSSSQQSSYSSNVNRASASSSSARYDDSRGQVRGEVQDGQRYYVEDNFGGRRYIDGPPQQSNDGGELELQSTPDSNLPAPALSQEPPVLKQLHTTGAPTSQPAYQTKPTTTYTPKKNNVRIVGGKLFHVEDDVEGPISIQFIGDHPNPGTRGYHVANSSYPPPGKPRDGTSAGGQQMHFIA